LIPIKKKEENKMAETTTIINQLKEILVNKLDVNLTYEDIDENASLYEDGLGLDSIAIVELIVLIEKEFAVGIEDEELNVDLFKSLNTLSGFIRQKIDQKMNN
jgi:acyl carrier protein